MLNHSINNKWTALNFGLQFFLPLAILLEFIGMNSSEFIYYSDEGYGAEEIVPSQDTWILLMRVGLIIVVVVTAYRFYASWINRHNFRFDNTLLIAGSVLTIIYNQRYESEWHTPQDVSSADLFVAGYRLVYYGTIIVIITAILNELLYNYKIKSIATKDTFEKVLRNLELFTPNIPVTINRISQISQVSEQVAEKHIKEILNLQSGIGKYMDLEKVFLRNDDTGDMIDQLIDEYHTMESGKVGKEE
ncbi:MAG: hypothetical protein ACXAD7_22470 [Candidatus Kariarchaeaceae archaeon]|jgi:hypothetical protein